MRSSGSLLVLAAIVVAAVLFVAMGSDESDRLSNVEDTQVRDKSGALANPSEESSNTRAELDTRSPSAPAADSASGTTTASTSAEAPTSSSGLGQRYPLIADLEVLDGTTLADLDLETLDEKQFGRVLRSLRAASHDEEQSLLALIPREQREIIDRKEAQRRRAAAVETYILTMPVSADVAFGEEPFIDLSHLVTQRLEQLRAANIEIHGHPRYDAMKIDRALARLPDGHPAVVEWVASDWGALRIGIDANGNELVRLSERYPGMP